MPDKKKLVINPGRMLTAPLATASPADTVAFGGDWGAGWVDWGWSDGGLGFSIAKGMTDVAVDQVLGSVDREINDITATISGAFAEVTVRKITDAYSLGVYTSQAPTSTAAGFEQLRVVGSDTDLTLSTLKVGVEFKLRDGAPLRLIFDSGRATGNVDFRGTKGDKATLPVEFTCEYDGVNRGLTIRRVVPTTSTL